jgi:hypothetical protein
MDEQAVTASADELAQLQRALDDSRHALARYLTDTRDTTANLRTLWREAVDDMLGQVARWVEGLAGAGAGRDTGVGALADVFGTVGSMAALLGTSGSPTHVQYDNPSVPRPSAAGLAARVPSGTQVVVGAGAVQITAQTLDERALLQAADTLAAEIGRRLTFDDARTGRL